MQKTQLILFVILFVVSCNTEEKFKDLNESLENSISQISYKTDVTLMEFEKAYQENSTATEGLYFTVRDIVLSIYKLDSLLLATDEISKNKIDNYIADFKNNIADIVNNDSLIDACGINDLAFSINSKLPFSTRVLLVKNELELFRYYLIQHYFNELQKIQIRFLDEGTPIAVVIPEHDVIKLGQTYKADIFYAKQFKLQEDAQIVLDNGEEVEVIDGIGKYKKQATSLGQHTLSGKIIFSNPATGDTVSFPFDFTFNVIN